MLIFRMVRARCAILIGTGVAACVPSPPPTAPTARPATPIVSVVTPPATSTETKASNAQPDADLLNAIQGLGLTFQGRVGISVHEIDAGWTVAFEGDVPLPQQSVSKLWVAIGIMDAVDRGALSLGDPIVVRPSDLTLFHQPIRSRVTPAGYRTTIGELLEMAMTRSDNSCNDILLWKLGGPTAVRRMLIAKKLLGVGFGPGERALQAETAGLSWRPEWAGGDGFLRARAALPYAVRRRALERYLADPGDGATAKGVALGLSSLARGELLSPSSTRHLLGLMERSKTGPLRLRSGLGAGWRLAHKTGTGQDLGTLSTGYNDVGIVTSPQGHRYAVAVMIAQTREPIPVRMRLMGNVTRAIVRADARMREDARITPGQSR